MRRGAAFYAAIGLLLAQPGCAEPVRDRQWSQLAAKLLPTLASLPSHAIVSQKVARLAKLRSRRIENCHDDTTCAFIAALWEDREIAAVAGSVAASRPASPASLALERILERELRAINGIIRVYALRAEPRYPAIDGPDAKPDTPAGKSVLADALMLARESYSDPSVSWDRGASLALSLLDANDRLDATRCVEADRTLDERAAQTARHIRWRAYRYSAILVPGIGPENAAERISPRSKLNARMAARKFAEGAAPFIIVSGGSVHPRGTRFVEAVELRRELVERFDIPADRIILDPYARHTTTNLRNATRRLAAAGAPLEKDVLVTGSRGFAIRCRSSRPTRWRSRTCMRSCWAGCSRAIWPNG